MVGVEETELDQLENNSFEKDDFNFCFGRQGQTVAVFYNEALHRTKCWHHQQNFTFMKRTGTDNLFKCPEGEGLDEVKSQYVSYADF